jgi:sugar lactone lactonase YvrE
VRGQISTDKACVRVREGGEVGSDRIGPEPFACMLVGPDGRTMFIIAGEWRGIEELEEALATRTGQVLLSHPGLERVGHNSLSL